MYKIRSAYWLLSPTWTVGTKKKGDWNVAFTTNLRLFYATVHKGAHDFFYKDPFGLKKPNPWFNRLKISAMNKCGTGVNAHMASIIGLSDIRVYFKTSQNSGCNVKNTLSIYGTTIHELGHSNQRSHGVNSFIFCSKLVRESWADAVEWSFCQWRYNTLDSNLALTNTTYNFLCNTNTTSPCINIEYPFARIRNAERGFEYSPIFIDLIECSVRNSQYRETNSSGNVTFQETMSENVCGYSLKQVEQAIANKGWSTNANTNMDNIRDYLQNNYSNITEDNIEPYFETYYSPHF